LRKNDQETFSDYLEDSSGLGGGWADEIVFPETEQEASEFLSEAAAKKIPVTISGAGTGIVGGRIPFGGAILSTANLNKILDIRNNTRQSKDKTAVVEPGVSIEQLCKETARFGLTYLPDPTEKNAYIGGTVSTNASGAQGFKYGPTRNYIKRIHIILPCGERVDIKRGQFIIKDKLVLNLKGKWRIESPIPKYNLPQIKNAAGYYLSSGSDLIDLFIGAEGTLGLISQIEVSLAQMPQGCFTALVFFNKAIPALDFVDKLKKRSYFCRAQAGVDDIDAACIEYFDGYSLNILKAKYPQLPEGKKAAVYFDQNITGDNSTKLLGQYINFFENSNISSDEVWFGDSASSKKLINGMRYDLPVLVNEQIKHSGFHKISTDIATDDSNFPGLYNFYASCLKNNKINYCIFGHIGENHLHVNLLPENENEFKTALRIYRQFIEKAVQLGGTIAAEHGIGKLKREYFKIMMGKKSLKEMFEVKRAIDPDLLLGRGNIFDDENF